MELFKATYKEEALELIEAMEKALLQMEINADNTSLIEEVFRDMHTLKGNSSMFGFKKTADFTHNLESIYDLVRSGKAEISTQILNITFSALDHLSLLVNNAETLNETDEKTHEQLSEKVVEIIRSIDKSFKNSAEIMHDKSSAFSGTNELKTYHISFKPHKDFFLNGSNPLNLLNELRELGECKMIAHTDKIPALEDFEFDSCYTSWDIYLSADIDASLIREIFSFVEDRCSLHISQVSENNFASDATVQDDKELPVNSINNNLKDAGQSLSDKNEQINTGKKNIISSIRVPSERLDILMNLVSELMTLQAKLGTLAEQNPQPELLSVKENLEKISTRLRDNAFNMCLVPVKNMVTPFYRLVRDLSAGLNKEIEFITEGIETELDKNMMEGLSDPIMHLLRNSVDHGIESADIRIKSGKPARGKIVFKAFTAGTNVYIQISDDGKGMDADKIRQKAIQKGIITNDDVLSEKDIFNLIFLPGFSTAENVSEISGRGVGMDVVKRKITDIRGQIKITSQVNAGTTITIKLPITVSIIDGLLVKINDGDFVIPLSVVNRCYEMSPVRQLNRFNNLIVVDGEQIPFISLSEEFDGIENTSPLQEIVIVFYEEKRVGLIVDKVVGKFQAVLKPLGKYFLHMDNISGATILGDGKIALVLDTNYVAQQFLHKKTFQHDTTNRVLSHV